MLNLNNRHTPELNNDCLEMARVKWEIKKEIEFTKKTQRFFS